MFVGVVAHRFEHVLPGNILFDVNEIETDALVHENRALFEASWRYGWPPIEYDGDLEILTRALKSAGVRAYSIGSSYGLSGWVLAGGCERVLRKEQARTE